MTLLQPQVSFLGWISLLKDLCSLVKGCCLPGYKVSLIPSVSPLQPWGLCSHSILP